MVNWIKYTKSPRLVLCLSRLIFISSLLSISLNSLANKIGIELSLIDQKDNPLTGAVVSLSKTAQEPSQNEQEGQPSPENLKEVSIPQINQQFATDVTVIQVGTLVNFPNNDDILHHVYSFFRIENVRFATLQRHTDGTCSF